MSTFVLRKIDETLWLKVQAKAAAEGITVKQLILKALAHYVGILVLLFFSTACAYHSPTGPSTPTVDPHAVAAISLTTTPGAGYAVVTAVVTSGDRAPMAGVAVRFSSSNGTAAPLQVDTDANGRAATTVSDFTTTATVSATGGTITTSTIINAPPPVVVLAPLAVRASATSATIGGATILTASATNAALSPQYAWTFGDGTSAPADASPSTAHTYPRTGTFTATVTVTDGAGRTATSSTSAVVNAVPVVQPPPPPLPPPPTALSASLSCSNLALVMQCNVAATFGSDTVASTDITGVDWDWGDGDTTAQNAALPKPIGSHTYHQPGVYLIVATLTVTPRANGAITATTSKSVTVP